MKEEGRNKTACVAAARTAAVAAAFCAVVAALLLQDYSRREWKDPLEAPDLQRLKAIAAKFPDDETVKDHLRQLDAECRAEYSRQRTFIAVGGLLLLGGIGIFLAAARSAIALRRKLPQPQPLATLEDAESRWTPVARWAVAGLAVAMIAVTGGLIVGLRSPLPEDSPEIAQQPRPDAVPQPPANVPAEYPSDAEIAKAWPRFRGPDGSGISAYNNVPDAWDGRSGKNIRWKTPVPLPGNNSPVIWGNRVFLTGADAERREVYCFDAGSGKLLWRRDAPGTPESTKAPPKVMNATGFASPTAATDGRRVYAIFANGDLCALDYEGQVVWSRSLGIPENNYGHAASLLLFRKLLLVPMDQGNLNRPHSKLLALDTATGKTVWEQKRKLPESWSTPIVIRAGDRDQVVTNCDDLVIAYELPGGAELWRAKCIRGQVGPSAAYANGMVYAPGEECPVYAIRADGRGDVCKTHIVWLAEDGTPDVCSPLATDKYLFLLTSEGMLTCYEAKQGEKLWEEDFQAKFQSSPGMAGGRLYLVGADGKTRLVEPGPKGCKRLGEAELGEPCVTSPAFQDGRLYLRGDKHLFCIGK